jgi:hypothetical protein
MKTLTLTLTEQQAQQLLTLVDAAVRAQGLQAALIAVPLHDLIQAAAEAADAPKPDPEPTPEEP